MKTTLNNIDPTRVKLTVEVPFEELKPAMDAAYKKVAQQVSIPGFRKGKVPAQIIDQRVGRGHVIEEAVNSKLGELYGGALEEHSLIPLGQPEIEIVELPATSGPAGGQLLFHAEVDVRPEITLPELEGINLTIDGGEVNDDDVEAELTLLRERFSSLAPVEREVADGDFVVLDMLAEIDGEEIERVEGTSYQVGSATLLPGLDEAIIGLAAGEPTTFTTKLAGGEREGEDADVTVTPTAVKERKLPEADDEFAELASEHDTIAELRESLREQAATTKTQKNAIDAQGKLFDYLRENTEFPTPENVVNTELERALEQVTEEERESRSEEIKEEITSGLRDQLLLDSLAESLKIDVSQNELIEFLLHTAQRYGMDPNEFIVNAQQSGQIHAFMGEIARNKGLAFALRKVTVQDASGAAVDLSSVIGSDEPQESEDADA